jgi:NitT/TauT family transport system permease protein
MVGDTTEARPTGKSKRRRGDEQPRFHLVLFCQVALLAAILIVWEIAIRAGWLRIYVYGAPSGIIKAFGVQLADGSLLRHFWVTAEESLLGFLIGSGFGSLLGLLLWLSNLWGRILRPYMLALNGVPKIALAPLIIVWFGLGMQSKVAIAAIITFIVAFITAYNGTQQIDSDYIKMMRSLGARPLQIFRIVVVPGSLAWIVAAFRLNVGFALIGAVVGEYISAEEGLGQMVYYSGQIYDLNSVWVGIFSLMIMALMFEALVRWVEVRTQW